MGIAGSATKGKAAVIALVTLLLIACTSGCGRKDINRLLVKDGGVELFYTVDTDLHPGDISDEQWKGTIETLRRRLDPGGREPILVERSGDVDIRIVLPGEMDPSMAQKIIGNASTLKFVDVGNIHLAKGSKVELIFDASVFDLEEESIAMPGNFTVSPGKVPDDEESSEFPPFRILCDPNSERNQIVITGEDLDWVETTFHSSKPVVSFRLSKDGSGVFARHTGANIGLHMAIILGDQVITCPMINSRIGRSGQIDGFSIEQAKELELQINAGRIPLPLKFVSEKLYPPATPEGAEE